MPERRDSWIARLTGAGQLQSELERMREEAAALRAELAAQYALTEQQAAQIAQHTREQERLEQQIEQLATQTHTTEQATRNTIRQAQAAKERIHVLQQACTQRDHELSQLRTVHDKVLKKNDALEERLSRNEHELRTVYENLKADRAALSRVIEERSSLRTRAEQREQEIAELQRQLILTQTTSSQQTGELTERLATMSAAQDRALLEERQRWLLLVTGFWKALVRALGPTAGVPLARELDGERVLGALGRASSPEAASGQLGRALSELSLCRQVSIASQGRELELRLQQPTGDGKGAQGWVGIFALQCLGSMLGSSLHPCALQDQDGELVVRARFREREQGELPRA